jgi:tRNA(Ile)-lysidine synthase
VLVRGAGTYALGDGASALRLALGNSGEGSAFDADALAWPLVLRARRPGDRMRPRGGRGSRKLSDLLIDAKVPRGARDQLPVLTTADDVVLFVPGLRPAELARPAATTRRFLRVALLDRSARTHID